MKVSHEMYTREIMKKRKDRNILQATGIDIAGFGLLILSPIIGPLPGPGGIATFLAGLGVLSLNYDWAERLLKELDNRRQKITEVIMTKPLVVKSIDAFAIASMIAGTLVLIFIENKLIQYIAIGSLISSPLVILLNNKRIDKLYKTYKKHKHK